MLFSKHTDSPALSTSLRALNHHRYYLVVTVGQKYRHGLTGSSASGPLIRLQLKCWPGQWSHLRLGWGRVHFQAHVAVWQNRTKALSFSLPVGWTWCLVPCHLGICNMAASLFKASKGERLRVIWKLQPYVTSSQKWHCIPSAVFRGLGASLLFFPHTEQGSYMRVWIPGVENIRNQLRV